MVDNSISLNTNLEGDLNELFERNALGNIASQLFPDYGDFFAVPYSANQEMFGLLCAFTKQDRNTFEYIGSLRRKGGVLKEEETDLLSTLKPHLHCSSKHGFDRCLIGLNRPFSRRITEFVSTDFTSSPEGKFFSWLDLGSTQIEYVDPQKLAARIKDLKVQQENSKLYGKSCIYVIHKVWYSERLCYYPSKKYVTCFRLNKGKAAFIEQHVNNVTKDWSRCCISEQAKGPRAFSVCLVPLSKAGSFGIPNYDVKLISTNPYIQSNGRGIFHAEELDFDFIHWLTSRVKSMTTKRFWQPALQKLFSFPSHDDTRTGLDFILDVMKKFQTEQQSGIQLVDISFVVPNIPSFFTGHPSMLTAFLRGAGIILTASQQCDNDDDDDDEHGVSYPGQIIFTPEHCQENLHILEALFTLLTKGVVTEEQGRTVSRLTSLEVNSLQELFYTQMKCICSPWKRLSVREKPLSDLWKKSSRTRRYLESLGFEEATQGSQIVVICPENCQLLNILSLFHDNID